MATKAGLARPGTRAINRAQIVDQNFLDFLDAWDSGAAPKPLNDVDTLLEIYESQLLSRHLDLVAREMRARNEGFYTIGSSGHEGNAVVGHLSRRTDPAFLHYRSGGFMMARGRKNPDRDPVLDTALSLAAAADDPASGGRHKVWGSDDWVLPQTSTIASHLPKAMGTATAIALAKGLGLELPVPTDSIVICSFGDASINHSTALGAFNATEWTACQNLPIPILFVCEDNGLGISVRTHKDWVENRFSGNRHIRYVKADGLNIADTLDKTHEAMDYCRSARKPVFLHLCVRRLLGHAGTDVETEYLSSGEVEANEAQDPLLTGARMFLDAGVKTPAELRNWYELCRKRARDAATKAAGHAKLTSREEIMAPLAPYHERRVHTEATRVAGAAERAAAFGGEGALPEKGAPKHLAININRALRDLMAKYDNMIVFGEDVAQKGGVYTVTSGLARSFSAKRVFNTLLDETTILGMAQGAAYMNLLPFPEIQYLAYYHNACDQIRGEACSLQYFSNGRYRNPMVMRIASLAYQKGFGGHFHNDNSFAALRDIPGLIVACPSRGDDAAMMLRTCAALARVDGRVVAFLEPIALYMTKDLFEPKDGYWQFPYPAPDTAVRFGEPRIYHPDANDMLIVTYGNGVPFALRTARTLAMTMDAKIRVLDLRWLKPLNVEAIVEHANATGRVLVVDEGRRTGGISEEIFTALDEHAGDWVLKRRVVGADSYIPLAAAADLVLVEEKEVLEAARELLVAT